MKPFSIPQLPPDPWGMLPPRIKVRYIRIHYVDQFGQYSTDTQRVMTTRSTSKVTIARLKELAVCKNQQVVMNSVLVVVERGKRFRVIKSRHERGDIEGAVEFLQPYIDYYIGKYCRPIK
jgi:hypothetical protein